MIAFRDRESVRDRSLGKSINVPGMKRSSDGVAIPDDNLYCFPLQPLAVVLQTKILDSDTSSLEEKAVAKKELKKSQARREKLNGSIMVRQDSSTSEMAIVCPENETVPCYLFVGRLNKVDLNQIKRAGNIECPSGDHQRLVEGSESQLRIRVNETNKLLYEWVQKISGCSHLRCAANFVTANGEQIGFVSGKTSTLLGPIFETTITADAAKAERPAVGQASQGMTGTK